MRLDSRIRNFSLVLLKNLSEKNEHLEFWGEVGEFFTREYKDYFGLSPRENIKKIRAEEGIN